MPDRDAPVTLCVDAGTTLIKAVVFGPDGRELAQAQAPTAVRRPAPGHSEQDMAEVWSAAGTVMGRAAAEAGRTVELVALTAQGDGAWLVDDGDRPVGPALLWDDARAADVLREWTAAGVPEAAFARNGSGANLGLPHTLLAHLRRHDPRRVAATAAVLTCGSWLYLQLTGVRGLHPSDASAPWLDIRTRTVSPELLELYGLADLAGLVPPVLSAEELQAPLRAVVAEACGLPAGVPVVLAPYDVVTAATGSGTVTVGQAYSVLGTTLCTGAVVAGADTGGRPTGLTLDTGTPPDYLRVFPTLAGTGVLEWAASLLGLAGAAALVERAVPAPPGAEGLTFLPYLSPGGERAPFLDPAARGSLDGLRFGHGPEHVARAVLEGLGHVIRDCLAATGDPPAELRLSGGGAASDAWAQLLADLTGVPTVRTTDAQVGARGAALHALVTTGHCADLPTAIDAYVTVRDRREPDPVTKKVYDGAHRHFLASRDALAPRWSAGAAESPS